MQFRHPVYGVVLVIGSCAVCLGATISVGPDAGDDYTTIQAAVDFATTGDTIAIDSGTYVDDDGDGVIVKITSKDLTLTAPFGGVNLDGLNVARGIEVKSASTLLYQLDLLNCTALDGEGGAGLWFHDSSGTAQNLLIISCTFTSCSSPVQFNVGGAIGIYGNSSSTVDYEIDECIFTSCSSADYAGALYSNTATGLIMNTSFIDCSAKFGGACEFREGTSEFYECVFQGNSATNDGGAIRVYSADAVITIEDSSFSENHAEHFGSAISQSTGDLTLTNSDFIDNESGFAGCLYLRDTDPAAIIEVSGCRFSGNETASGYPAEGIFSEEVINLTVLDSFFCDHSLGGDITVAYTDGGGNDLGNWCCPGDIDEDGDVDADDLGTLLTGYGDASLDADDREDCSRDGDVDVEDLISMLSQWGTCE